MGGTRAVRWVGRASVLAVGLVIALPQIASAVVPMTTVSTDPFTNTTSYHQTQVEPDTYAFGSTIVSTFQSGRFEDGGSSDLMFATSTNSGATWTTGALPGTTVFATPPGPWARISDPAVAFDPKHGVWMISGLGIDASATGKAILISRSLDGGLTWQNPVTVSTGGVFSFYDKEWVVCDTTAASPFYGNCYVEWDDAGTGNTLKLSRSTDGGATWSSSSAPGSSVLGGQPLVQPNGTVIMPIDDSFESHIETFVSTDGGASYTGPHTAATITWHSPAGDIRNDPLPSAEIDAAGTVYIVWEDCRFRTGCARNDIVMTTTTDGLTFTPVVRIPIDRRSSTRDHFIPGIGVEPGTSGSTAHLGLTYYFYPQSSCTTSPGQLDVGFVQSTNGGANWTKAKLVIGPLTLTWLPHTNQGYMVGDYISTSYIGSKAFPVVADATTGTCQLGQITSCHEFMVAPTTGLSAASGSIPVDGGAPVATSGATGSRGPRTAN